MIAPFPSFTAKWHTDTYAAIDPTNPTFSLRGKTVVITGAGSGIGGAIASSFAKANVSQLALIGRRANLLEAKRAELLAISPSTKILVVSADISNEQEINTAFEKIAGAFGPLDILVNNAAYFSGAAPSLEDDVKNWFMSFEVNARGTFLVAQAFLKKAIAAATIVNSELILDTSLAHKLTSFFAVSTGITHLPPAQFPGFSAYAASKIASTVYLSYVQKENPNLHVVHVHPGQIVTDMAHKVGMTTPIDLGAFSGNSHQLA